MIARCQEIGLKNIEILPARASSSPPRRGNLPQRERGGDPALDGYASRVDLRRISWD